MTLVERLRADEIEGGLFKLELRYEAADRIEELEHLLTLAVKHWEEEARPRIEILEEEIERLKAELHVIPPGGVDSRCILDGCRENKRHHQGEARPRIEALERENAALKEALREIVGYDRFHDEFPDAARIVRKALETTL